MENNENSFDLKLECTDNADSFDALIQREMLLNLRRLEQEKTRLVLKKFVPTFSEEIRCIMYTNGDVKYPLDESVLLIERLLRDQMNILLTKASKKFSSPAVHSITHEHLLTLLSKNKTKLRRLLMYLNMKDTNDCILQKKYDQVAELTEVPQQGKRVRACVEFLNGINKKEFESIMDTSIEDPVTAQRLEKRYLMTLHMDDDEYLEFSKMLSATFCPRKSPYKFSAWLLADRATLLTPTLLALEIINYCARETVYEIVELSLKVKDMRINGQTTCDASKSEETFSDTESQNYSEVCNKSDNWAKRSDGAEFDESRQFNTMQEDYINGQCNSEHIFGESTASQELLSRLKEIGNTRYDPITPEDIRNALYHLLPSPFQYQVNWKKLKKATLLCL